jgi:hypothetical protein
MLMRVVGPKLAILQQWIQVEPVLRNASSLEVQDCILNDDSASCKSKSWQGFRVRA